MIEPLILLGLTDGVAAGPTHTPAEGRFSHGRWQTLQWRIDQNNGFPPTRWLAMCGTVGILYSADAEMFDEVGECFMCRCKKEASKRHAPSRSTHTRYTNDADRLAARRLGWRESKRRRAAAAIGVKP